MALMIKFPWRTFDDRVHIGGIEMGGKFAQTRCGETYALIKFPNYSMFYAEEWWAPSTCIRCIAYEAP